MSAFITLKSRRIPDLTERTADNGTPTQYMEGILDIQMEGHGFLGKAVDKITVSLVPGNHVLKWNMTGYKQTDPLPCS